jgi:hypothetical protein
MASLISRGVLPMLGAAVILLAAKTWFEWTDENNTLPMNRILSAEQIKVVAVPEIATEPRLVQLDHTHFALVNRTPFLVHYTGYSIDWGKGTSRPRRGEIQPFHTAHFDNGKAHQNSARGRRPNFGVELTVPPGHGGRFEVNVPLDCKIQRLTMTYWRGDGRRTETAWNEPIR